MSSFGSRVEDKLLDKVAGAVANALFGVAFSLLTLIVAFASGNQPVGWLLAFVLTNVFWVVLVFRFWRSSKWGKSGGIWWLHGDLMEAMRCIGSASKFD